MTLDELRHVRLAEWNAREAIARAAVGEHEQADYHLCAAREALRNSGQAFSASFYSADDVAAICAEIKDRQGIVA